MTTPDRFGPLDRYASLFVEPELTIDSLNQRRAHLRRRRTMMGGATATFGVAGVAALLALALPSGRGPTTEIVAGGPGGAGAASTEPPPPAVSPPVEFEACVPTNETLGDPTEEQIAIQSPAGDITLTRTRGEMFAGASSSEDPRFEGTHLYGRDSDEYALPGGETIAVEVYTHRVETDEGAWHWSGGAESLDLEANTGNITLTGEGGYDGLSAIAEVRGPAEGPCLFELTGYVVDTLAPSEPPEVSTLPAG